MSEPATWKRRSISFCSPFSFMNISWAAAVMTKPGGTFMCSRFLTSPRLAILPPALSTMSLVSAASGMTSRFSVISFFWARRASISR